MTKNTVKILKTLAAATAEREILLQLVGEHSRGDVSAAPRSRHLKYMQTRILPVYISKLNICKKSWKETPSTERTGLKLKLVEITEVAKTGITAAKQALAVHHTVLRSDYLKRKTENN